PAPQALASALAAAGGSVAAGTDGLLEVAGLTAAEVGDLALARGIALHELAPWRASLEEAFMELTADSVDYLAGDPS
ncbi:MAG: ABC transporter ATP-binding protein, partial [Actinomycetota bacterium]|nr:ABC transporter ATP-binding protein [Actinomycetota bacterium]